MRQCLITNSGGSSTKTLLHIFGYIQPLLLVINHHSPTVKQRQVSLATITNQQRYLFRSHGQNGYTCFSFLSSRQHFPGLFTDLDLIFLEHRQFVWWEWQHKQCYQHTQHIWTVDETRSMNQPFTNHMDLSMYQRQPFTSFNLHKSTNNTAFAVLRSHQGLVLGIPVQAYLARHTRTSSCLRKPTFFGVQGSPLEEVLCPFFLVHYWGKMPQDSSFATWHSLHPMRKHPQKWHWT